MVAPHPLMARASLVLAGGIVIACAGAAPTPQIVYVSAPPVIQPTPLVVYVTPVPQSEPSATPASHVLDGTVTAVDPTMTIPFGHGGGACASHGVGFAGVESGTGVTVKDAHGMVIGAAVLGTGVGVEDEKACAWAFVVELPTSDFYVFTIGTHGDFPESYAALAGAGWKLNLTVGP